MAYIPFNQLIDAVSTLDDQEKDILVRILQETINASEGNENAKIIVELRENRFHEGLCCLYCGSDRVRRNGTYRNRQRYHCRSCNRTFNDFTGTPIHHTKYLAKWGKFLEFMIEGYSVRKCGELLKISKDTAFAWRHKVLHALAECPIPQLRGLVEADETYELYSEKGRRGLTRKARKRGGTASQRGISNEQTCILVVRDRDKQTIAQVTGLGRVNSETLQKRIGGHIEVNSIMCTDEEPVFHAFCRKSQLKQKVIRANEGRVIDGVYHIQNVNSLHGRYKRWVDRFNGIATKYTDNYLTWFIFLDETIRLAENKRRKQLLLQSTQNMMRTTGRFFPKYYDTKLLAICG